MSLPARLREHARALAGDLPAPFWVLWTGTLVNRCGMFVVPFLAIYLTRERGFSPSQAGLVAALYGAGATLAGAIGGVLADRVGRRATLVGALALGGAAMIGLGFARRIEVIAPATFLVALITEMYRPAVQAATADLVRPEHRVRAFGLVYWVVNFGAAVGLTLGGLLATVSFTLLFVLDGVTSMLFALLIARGVPETRPARAAGAHAPRAELAGFLAPFRDPALARFLALSFVMAFVFMQHNTALPLDLVAHGLSSAQYGAVVALNGVLIVALQPFLGPLLARHDRSRVLALGALVVGIGFGFNAIAGTAPMYALGVVVWTLGEMAVLPVANAVVADLAPAETRGRYQGAYGMAFGLATCLAPALGSWVLQHLGHVTLWLGTFALGALVAAGHLALGPTLRRLRAERLAAQLSARA